MSVVNTGPSGEDEDEEAPAKPVAASELWDLTRPLEGSCRLELKGFDDPEGKMVGGRPHPCFRGLINAQPCDIVVCWPGVLAFVRPRAGRVYGMRVWSEAVCGPANPRRLLLW
jgi:hypothetical protein